MELSPTAYVVLGMLSWRPMSGYDIKSVVDRSTRFFWAASYSQIYGELRALRDAGLITADDGPQGARRRTAHRITELGRRALRDWLAREPETFELRDEGLLKLFFASADPASAASTIAAKRDRHAEVAEQLESMAAAGTATGYAGIVLAYGIECNRWMADWCERTLTDLAELPASAGARQRETI